MPEPELDKPEPTVTPEEADATAPAPPDAIPEKPEDDEHTSLPRGAKAAIVILSLLSVLLLAALLELAFLPQLIERDINSLLQNMTEGGGMEFKVKTISLTSAEVACKLTDTTRDGSPLKVGSIGAFSIRFSPIPLLFRRTIESIEIENCNVVTDYSDGSIAIPAYDIVARSFLSGEKKEKSESVPIDDLNAVIPVRIGSISLSGSLTAVSRGEDTLDTLNVPYAVTVEPDPEQGWNKLECSLMTHFSTNGIRCRAVYLHQEKKVSVDIEDFSFSTASLPGTIRSHLPLELRAGFALSAKAEFDLDSLTVHESSSIEGNLAFSYRTQQGLRIDNTATPFSLKVIPRPIPTVKPMNPPRTENLLLFTLGPLKGKYDSIPFELSDFETTVSLRHFTLQGGFRLTVADSDPADFSLSGEWTDSRKALSLTLKNNPLLKVKYKGMDVSCRPDSIIAGMDLTGGALSAVGSFSCDGKEGFRVDVDGGALNYKLKGMNATFRPESFETRFYWKDGKMESALSIRGGELLADYKGMELEFNPEKIGANLRMEGGQKVISAELTGGELEFEKYGMEASFKPETFKFDMTLTDGIRQASAGFRGDKLAVKLNGMTCDVNEIAFDAASEDGKKYQADAKIRGVHVKQNAAGLVYEAPEFGLDATFDEGVLSGEAVCEDSRLVMPERKIVAQNLRWDFPFDYSLTGDAERPDDAENAEKSPAATPRTGKVSLGKVEYDGVQTASLDGTILWDDAEKTLHLTTDAHMFSIDGQIYTDARLGAEGVEIECGIVIPEQWADISKDLAKIFPEFEDISCTGKVGGTAVYRILPKTTTGRVKFGIAETDIFIPEKLLEVHGFGLGFEIPEINVMKSAPGQTISFKSVKFGKIETGAGKAAFRMEAPDTWQVENAVLDWCNGHIRLGGITYCIGQTTTEAVLYCDRLELPIFLTQIGMGEISGSGAINGTIPVVLTQECSRGLPDNIYFEDAFLFSTPGEDGIIKGEIDESILNAQTGIEMELVKDALKDFSYSWIRMNMLSTGKDREDMKLSLQLNGRPNHALYYSFDEKTSAFVKSATPCIFQGIRLDANVNVESGKALELVDYARKIFSKGD